MQVIDLLTPNRIAVDAVARSKKHSLELASELLATEQPDLDARKIFAGLCSRERLGTTGLGHGVALPHGRLSKDDTVSGAFLRLKEAVDFEAPDQQPVDLIFALVVPTNCEGRHLDLLAQLADLFNDEERRQALRAAPDSRDVLHFLEEWQAERISG